jgi:Flp pilus assembly protein TadG
MFSKRGVGPTQCVAKMAQPASLRAEKGRPAVASAVQARQERTPVDRGHRRQRGQVLILVAFAVTALIGMTGMAIDLGFAFAHRRQVQNAADAAALAGAHALSRYVIYTKIVAQGITPTSVGLPSINPYGTTSAIWQDATSAAAATSVLPNDDLGQNPTDTPTWPSGGSTLHGWWIVAGGGGTPPPNGTQGAPIDPPAGTPPGGAVGVQVRAVLRSPTTFMNIFGIDHLDVAASSRVVFKPQGKGSGPFIVCGSSAWKVSPTSQDGVNILTGNPPAVNFASYAGATFAVYTPQLNAHNASCGAGSQFKGRISPAHATCDSTGGFPCTAYGDNGNTTAAVANVIAGLNGCIPGNTSNCVAQLLIADQFTGTGCNGSSYLTCSFRIVTQACFYLTQQGSGTNTTVNGILLPTCATGGTPGAGPLTAVDFTVESVPDCDNPAVGCPY